jgi:hypothetical protein
MPKVNPEEVAIGSGHIRNDSNNNRDQNVTKIVERDTAADGMSIQKECCQQKRERLGKWLLREAGDVLSSLKIVKDQCSVSNTTARICDYENVEDDDEPPPLI